MIIYGTAALALIAFFSQLGCGGDVIFQDTPAPSGDGTGDDETPGSSYPDIDLPPAEGCIDLSQIDESLKNLYGYSPESCAEDDWLCNERLGQYLLDQACSYAEGQAYPILLTTDSTQRLTNTSWTIPFGCKVALMPCDHGTAKIALFSEGTQSGPLFALDGSSLAFMNTRISDFRDVHPVKGGILYATNNSYVGLFDSEMSESRAQQGAVLYAKESQVEIMGGTYSDNITQINICDGEGSEEKGGSVLWAEGSDVHVGTAYTYGDVTYDVGPSEFLNNETIQGSCAILAGAQTAALTVEDGNVYIEGAIFQNNGTLGVEGETIQSAGAVRIANGHATESHTISVHDSHFLVNAGVLGALSIFGNQQAGGDTTGVMESALVNHNVFSGNTGLAGVVEVSNVNAVSATGNRFEDNVVDSRVVYDDGSTSDWSADRLTVLSLSLADTMTLSDTVFWNNHFVPNTFNTLRAPVSSPLGITLWVDDVQVFTDTRSSFLESSVSMLTTGLSSYGVQDIEDMEIWNPLLMYSAYSHVGISLSSVSGVIDHATLIAQPSSSTPPFSFSGDASRVAIRNSIVSYLGSTSALDKSVSTDDSLHWYVSGMPLYCSDIYPLTTSPAPIDGNMSVDPLLDASGRPLLTSPVIGQACPPQGTSEVYPNNQLGAYGGPYAFMDAPF